MIHLRPYQRSALDATYDFWRRGGGNPLIVAPCGAGKSVIIAALCQEALSSWPGTRILMLTHRKELLEQDGAELAALWPEAPLGYYSAGLRRRDTIAPILFAGIQTFHRVAGDFDAWDLVIVDEAHLIPKSAETMYGSTLRYLGLANPDVRVVGLTATPYRLDSGPLSGGGLFDAVAYEIEVQTLVDAGHLVPVVARGGHARADLRGVHRRGGEFVPAEAEAAFRAAGLVRRAVDEVVAAGADRRAWLLYCSGVAHATDVLEELRGRGVDAEIVTGGTPRREREEIVERFRAGGLKALVNVDVLTTGANFPQCDLLALLRATESAALYVQIVGRGMRVAEGKKDCLLLDFGGNVLRHGPIDAVRPKAKGEGGTAPAKECPQCQALVAIGVLICPDCGWEWPALEDRGPSHTAKAYTGAVLKSQEVPDWRPVAEVSYSRHQKAGRPDSVRVRYQVGLVAADEWWCPEHGGYAAEKTWLRLRKAGWMGRRPDTVTDLLAGVDELRRPVEILIEKDGKYLRIAKFRYADIT
jgi:DNA repair protein RadD